MKRISVILLSTFYLILSIGATINVHYCGGNFSSIKVNSNTHSCCCAVVDEVEMGGCCKDESFVVQLDSEQYKPTVLTYNINSIAHLVDWNENFESIELEPIGDEFIQHDLPPPDNIAKYIANVSLTFYG